MCEEAGFVRVGIALAFVGSAGVIGVMAMASLWDTPAPVITALIALAVLPQWLIAAGIRYQPPDRAAAASLAAITLVAAAAITHRLMWLGGVRPSPLVSLAAGFGLFVVALGTVTAISGVYPRRRRRSEPGAAAVAPVPGRDRHRH